MTSFRIIPATALVVVLTLLCPSTVLAADDDVRRQIVVQGEGVVTGTPDMAVVRAGVITEASTAGEALAQNSDTMNEIFGLLDGLGVDARDRRTSGFNVSPTYSRGTPQEPSRLMGYRVENQLTVRVRQIPRLGRLLDQLVKSGANRIHGVQFTFANPVNMQDEARKRAVAEAKRRATIYAAEAGVALGRVLSIAGPTAAPQPVPRALTAMAAEGAVPTAPGEQEVRVAVTVTFAIK